MLAIIGGTGYAAQGGTDKADPDRDSTTVTTTDRTPDETSTNPVQQLLDACHDTESRHGAAEYLWRGGEPEVITSVVTAEGDTRAFLRAGDGKTWAECHIVSGHTDGVLMPAYRTAADPEIAGQGGGYGVGQACDTDRDVVPSCRTFVATQDGRRDPAVARVEARFMDGKWERVDAVDGYYFLEHHGTLPDDVTWDSNGMPVRNGQNTDDTINRMRLLDADGNLLAYWDASQNRNGINAGNDRGVADLEDYPLIQSKLAGPAGDREFP